jgi:hypothetical protein
MDVSEDNGRLDGDDENDEDEAQLSAMMGFKGFGTTKQKKIAGNNAYGVRKDKKTQYRQYMYVPLAGPDVRELIQTNWIALGIVWGASIGRYHRRKITH